MIGGLLEARSAHMKTFPSAQGASVSSIARTITFDGTDLPADCVEFCVTQVGIYQGNGSAGLGDLKITQAGAPSDAKPGSIVFGNAGSTKVAVYGDDGVPLKRADGAITFTYTHAAVSSVLFLWVKGYWR